MNCSGPSASVGQHSTMLGHGIAAHTESFLIPLPWVRVELCAPWLSSNQSSSASSV